MYMMPSRDGERMTRSSPCIATAISRNRSSRGTLRNTRTDTAPPACWIFWTRNEVTDRRNWVIGRHWRRTCCRWSSFVKRLEQGAYHEIDREYRLRSTVEERPAGDSGCRDPHACRLPLAEQRKRHDLVFIARELRSHAAIVYDSPRPDEPCASAHGKPGHDDAHSTVERNRGLQRLQNNAGDQPDRRPGKQDPCGSRRSREDEPTDAGRKQPGLRSVAGRIPQGR